MLHSRQLIRVCWLKLPAIWIPEQTEPDIYWGEILPVLSGSSTALSHSLVFDYLNMIAFHYQHPLITSAEVRPRVKSPKSTTRSTPTSPLLQRAKPRLAMAFSTSPMSLASIKTASSWPTSSPSVATPLSCWIYSTATQCRSTDLGASTCRPG